MPAMEKPVCGSESENATYDFPLHVAAVFIVFFASIGGCGFPVVAKKVRWMKIPPTIFFFCKHFGTGVLIATAFVHLLPTAFQSLNDPCLPDLFTDDYPALPGVIMMGSLFLLFVVEMWLNSVTGGHSHGSATGAEFNGGANPNTAGVQAAVNQPRRGSFDSQRTMAYPNEKRVFTENSYPIDNFPFPKDEEGLEARSEMPPWFIVFYEQYVRQREEMVNMVNRAMPALPNHQHAPALSQNQQSSHFEDDVESGNVEVDAMALKKQSMQITLIEGGILFHSVFVGMTVSITSEGFIVLLIAIVFHQMFEGLGLGSRIAAVPYPNGSFKPWALVVAFGSTAPIGQAIGLFTRNTYDPNSAFGLIIVGIFNAISSGLLIYAALVDLLAEDFLSEEAQHTLTGSDKTKAFCYVLMGAAGMAIVGAFA
ncbi:Zinc/iron permease [Massarina eburnea CBS 473.64]|uniref:Zinc/iron permease n=1 Tax=Massarina eburnea CBS 473.64 TaxID=1395130 RepID=A0A6A6S2K7_9PLEO|nr:Zinc/iron permease [Massarina eburnea CBS 473.64]